MATFTQLLFEQHKLLHQFKQTKGKNAYEAIVAQMELTQKIAIDLQIAQLQTVLEYDANANVALNHIKSNDGEVARLKSRVRRLQRQINEYEHERRFNHQRRLSAETIARFQQP